MYTLYCFDGTRATAAQMTLAEAGLSFERKTVDITAGAHRTVEVQEPVKRSYYPHRYAVRADDVGAVRRNANQVFTQRWQLVEAHLRDNGPYHLGLRFSLADIYLLVTSTYSRDLASGEFPAIERCVQCTAERPQVAPILDDHLAGLAHIGEIGVPQ